MEADAWALENYLMATQNSFLLFGSVIFFWGNILFFRSFSSKDNNNKVGNI